MNCGQNELFPSTFRRSKIGAFILLVRLKLSTLPAAPCGSLTPPVRSPHSNSWGPLDVRVGGRRRRRRTRSPQRRTPESPGRSVRGETRPRRHPAAAGVRARWRDGRVVEQVRLLGATFPQLPRVYSLTFTAAEGRPGGRRSAAGESVWMPS